MKDKIKLNMLKDKEKGKKLQDSTVQNKMTNTNKKIQ